MKNNEHELLEKYIQAFIGRFKKYPCFATTEVANGIETTILLESRPIAIGYCNTDTQINSKTYTLSAIEAFKNSIIKIETSYISKIPWLLEQFFSSFHYKFF